MDHATHLHARPRRRRRLAALLALAVASGSLGAGALSLAIFTDSQAVSGNAFSTGTIVLGATRPRALLSASGLMPGSSVSGTLVVSNAGTGALRYAMTSSSTNADGKNLRDQLTVAVRTLGSGCPAFDGTSLYSGALSAAAIGNPAQGAQAGDRRPRRRDERDPVLPGHPPAQHRQRVPGRRDHGHVHLQRRADGQQLRWRRPERTPTMTATRWTRRSLDALLLVAVVVVIVTAGITVLAPVLGGRALVIGGGSMEPSIPQGALVVALPSDTRLRGRRRRDGPAGGRHAVHPPDHPADRAGRRPLRRDEGRREPRGGPGDRPHGGDRGAGRPRGPVLGFVSALLGTGARAGGVPRPVRHRPRPDWILEELEEQRCPVCAAADAAMTGRAMRASLPGHLAPAAGVAAAGMLGALPSFAAPRARRAGVRETGRARAAGTPVLLERDRRDPRRRGVVTVPVPAGPSPEEQAAGSEPSVDIGGDLAA